MSVCEADKSVITGREKIANTNLVCFEAADLLWDHRKSFRNNKKNKLLLKTRYVAKMC